MKLIKFANILVLNNSGEVLILRRTSSHRTRPLALDLPGGGLEAGEGFEDAAVRELREETGLSVAHGDLKLVCDRHQLDGDRNLHGALFVARLHESDPPINLSDEHDKHYWLKAKDITDLPQFHQESVEFAIVNGFCAETFSRF